MLPVKSRHLGTIAQLCRAIYIFATKARIDDRKKLVKQQYLFQMSSNQHETWHAGLGRPGHIVLDGNSRPRKGTQQPPLFGSCLLATVAHLSYCLALVIT